MRYEAKDLERDLSALGPEGFAGRVGLPFRRSGASVAVRCLFHDDNSPSASLTLGERGTLRLHCFACDQNWDAHAIVAEKHGLDARSDFSRVLEHEADLLGGTLRTSPSSRSTAIPAPNGRKKLWPDSKELHDLWSRGHHYTGDGGPINLLFTEKHWNREVVARYDLARVLPARGPFPPWWPESWSSAWRVAARLFDSTGSFRTIQARAIGNAKPKDRFPRGRLGSGVFFADDLGRALLRGDLADAEGVDIIVAEGLTSWVRTCCWCASTHHAAAVLGVGSFSTSAFADIHWPAGGEYVIATDGNNAGDNYAKKLRLALPRSARVRRIDFRRFK